MRPWMTLEVVTSKRDPGRLRHQRGEPARAPPPTPPVDRVAGHPNLLPERAVVFPLRQRPHQRSTLAGRQRRVDHLLDQFVTEQRHPAGPLSPQPGLLLSCVHPHPSSTPST
jgi:hypothetical protein